MNIRIENVHPADKEAVITLGQPSKLLTDGLQVPAARQQMKQFGDLCPASAIIMKRILNPNEA